MSKEQRIKELEEELKTTKYNKRTQHHVGLLKARIAKLKQSVSVSKTSSKPSFSIKKSGDATVILIGPPSVGKSTLKLHCKSKLNQLKVISNFEKGIYKW